MSKQSFLQGALVLVAASVITKILGMILQVVFARELGAEGFGLFRAVNPLFYMLLTLSTLALPTALSKVIAEALALGDLQKVRRAMRFSMTTVILLSGLITMTTIVFAPIITSKWLDPRVYWPLLAAVIRIPLVCVSAIVYGYYMGIQNQTPPAIAWIVETFARTALTIPLIYWMNQYGLEYGAVAVMLGIGIGELFGFLYMYWFYRVRDRHLPHVKPMQEKVESRIRTIRALGEVSIPTTFKNILGLIAYAAEPLILYAAFSNVGVAKEQATSFYGSISMAVQLLLIPTVFSSSLSTIIVPAVSEAVAINNSEMIRRRLYQIIRATMMIGLPSTVLFMIMGQDLAETLYHDKLAGQLLVYIAPVCLFIYIREPLTGILQGLNKATLATAISLTSSLIRMACIYYFVNMPGLGIYGVAKATAIAAIVSTVISFYMVNKYVHVYPHWVDIVKILVVTVFFALIIHQIKVTFDSSNVTMVMTAILSGGTVYLLSLFYMKVVRIDTLEKIPKIGVPLAKVLRRIPFIR